MRQEETGNRRIVPRERKTRSGEKMRRRLRGKNRTKHKQEQNLLWVRSHSPLPFSSCRGTNRNRIKIEAARGSCMLWSIQSYIPAAVEEEQRGTTTRSTRQQGRRAGKVCSLSVSISTFPHSCNCGRWTEVNKNKASTRARVAGEWWVSRRFRSTHSLP